ncbi:GNAT family N-acetyltransferase [bacterium]|nr:GNAT family N-acetyltransferase [bacterium]
MHIDYIKLIGNQINAYFEDLAHLRITIFREFPYLYEGSYAEEKQYIKTYQNSKKSLLVLAKHNDQIIGATTCIPMADETEEFYQSFLDYKIDISQVFYFGESVILKEFRGNKIGHEFFKLRESHAKQHMQDLKYTSFCAVDRAKDHPLRPDDYTPLNNFWQRMGYKKHDDMKVYYSWKDVDRQQEDTKAMTVWLKQWA